MPEPTSLASTLKGLRSRIARASSQRLNEENTKATLIEPVLRTLGWDVEDVDEVVREYRIKSRDKPVDYGLFLLRTPRLFVEAKALGENLDDRRWSNQIMGYAGVAGVQWIVLTDGNEYRIYNTHAPVSVEEKLFRSVKITDDGPLVHETLELLAKDRMEENRIEVLWRAHFVDRHVRAAIEQIFAGEGDLLLVNYVAQHTKNLTADEIRSSLKRCRVALDFPLPTQELLRQPAAKEPRAKREPTGARSEVTLQDLIQAGLLRPPVALERDYKEKRLTARIESDGTVTCLGKTYDSLSMAGAFARASVARVRADGKPPATNGWTFWKLRDPTGELVEVDVVRQRLTEGGGGRSASKTAT
jgi:predicted type IV restriction endonuclease